MLNEQIVKAIQERTSYGRRTVTLTKRQRVAIWSNADRQWYIAHGYGIRRRGETMTLDANMILVPVTGFSEKDFDNRLYPELSLYANSFEARGLVEVEMDLYKEKAIKELNEHLEFVNQLRKTEREVKKNG